MNDYDENEHAKETFAHFGRAYYMSNVFETGLALAILQLDFLIDIKTRSQQEGWKPIKRKQYEEKFEAFLKKQHAQTLGNLIRSVQKLLPQHDVFQKVVLEVKKQRDFLAHHYFRERSIEFESRKGKDKMIEELRLAQDVFLTADQMLDKIMEPHRIMLGFTDELLEEEMAAIRREAAALDED